MTFFHDSFLSICLFSTIVFFNTIALQSIDFENSSQNVLLFFDGCLTKRGFFSYVIKFTLDIMFTTFIFFLRFNINTMKTKINFSLLWFWGRLGRQGSTEVYWNFESIFYIFIGQTNLELYFL